MLEWNGHYTTSSMTNDKSSRKIVLLEIILREDFCMAEKMLVTQALDERDLLVKKI